MIKKNSLILILLLSSLTIFSQTVVDIIVNSADHNTLEAAVIAAELDDDLATAGPFTVFAPTDAAFNNLAAGTVDELLLDPTGNLARILLYHVVGGELMSTDLSDGQSETTLLGQNIEVTISTAGVFINGAQVTVTNIEATNGVVHVLDAVILPPAATIVDVVVNSDAHTTLEAAVIAAELADVLSGDGPFTLFAPTDAAFGLLAPGTLDQLLMDPTGELANILKYHALSGEVLSTDLSDGMSAATLIGDNIDVTINSTGVFINNAQVTVANIRTFNGVVHVIDAVLLPTPTAVNDLTESSMNIFPNPASAQLNLELPAEMINQRTNIQMINTSGQVVKTWSDIIQNTTIDISNHPTGMYFFLLTTDTHFAKAKVMIK